MDIKTIASTIIGALAALATGFGLADATTVSTLQGDLTTIVAAVISVVGVVSTVFFHKKAVAAAAAPVAPATAPKA